MAHIWQISVLHILPTVPQHLSTFYSPILPSTFLSSAFYQQLAICTFTEVCNQPVHSITQKMAKDKVRDAKNGE